MKFRAVAVGVEIDGHGLQIFTQSLANAKEWAKLIAAQKECSVQIFQVTEALVMVIKQPETQ